MESRVQISPNNLFLTGSGKNWRIQFQRIVAGKTWLVI
jgi:hypothetical protein